MDLKGALDVAVAAARDAGSLLRRDFHRPGGARGARDKAEADVEAETLIRGRLLAAFPSWRYLGEETGRGDGPEGSPIWLVDPNDGTRDYLSGRRGSAVSIGLLAEARPVLGVVYAFAYPDDDGDLFVWAEGQGPLRRNGLEVAAHLPEGLGPLDVVLVSGGGDRDPQTNLRCAEPARFRSVPSIAHRLALLATGEAAATTSLFDPGAWDYAAGHALVTAAGGVLLNEAGRRVAYEADGQSKCHWAFAGSAAVAATLAGRPWGRLGSRSEEDPRPVRLRRGEAVEDAGRLRRAQGCFLGQVAGDNLGALVEFASAEEVAARYPDGPRLLADGGRWGLVAGQPTDDSELALALARSIVSAGRYAPEAALAAYREWAASSPFDIGRTTAAALRGQPDTNSQANGSLMRASPLGLFAHALPLDEAARIARTDSALTHPHPVCRDAVAAYVVAIGRAVARGDGPRETYAAALGWADRDAVAPVTEALKRAADEPPRFSAENAGWVLVALQNAFHRLLYATSLEDGVVTTVRMGGDSDTNAAVAGALLGAVHGRNAVPAQWRAMVLSCRAHPLRAHRARPPAYWPTDVLELSERLLVAGTAATLR